MDKRIILKTCLTIVVLVSVSATGTITKGTIIYVEDDATGFNDGTSWENAFVYLQDALMMASTGDEIRVAQGIYKPDQFVLSKRANLGRMETFQLINSVSLKGGYAGLGEPDPDVRDIELYETILTGDLNGDDAQLVELLDLLYEHTRGENSYHVVTGINIDDTTVLDGFNITAGNANDPESADPNSNGAGLYNFQSSPTVINCIFTGNSARWSGAGMYNISSSPVVINCTFNKNSSGTSSGGYGGGMQFKDSIEPMFFGCNFSGNSAHRGAAARFIQSSPILTNCLFTGNSADNNGGAIAFTNMSTPTLANCTFAANIAPQGCALSCDHVLYGPSNVYINNCILWNDGDQIWNNDNSTITITFSNVQGLTIDRAGMPKGCTNRKPSFSREGYWDENGLWIDGDYHLKSQAGRWNPDSESWVIDDITSPCIDTGDPNSPIGQEYLPNGSVINMGAYGGTSEASKSYVGE